MKAKLVRIGNSRGVRIPKSLIEEAGLDGDVEMRVDGRSLVITPAATPRAGWAKDARRMSQAGESTLLDPPTETALDRKGWKW